MGNLSPFQDEDEPEQEAVPGIFTHATVSPPFHPAMDDDDGCGSPGGGLRCNQVDSAERVPFLEIERQAHI
jgi:hypothetical protein